MDQRLPHGCRWNRFRETPASGQSKRGGVLTHLLRIAAVLAASASGAYVAPGAAQDYPAKPIRIVVPFPAGSGADIVARTVAAKLTERWRQQVVTDPRPGATGIIAAKIVLAAPPDGYTLMLGSSSSHAISMSMHRDLPYNAVRDFAPVSMTAVLPMLMVVHPSLPVRNVKTYIAFAKA